MSIPNRNMIDHEAAAMNMLRAAMAPLPPRVIQVDDIEDVLAHIVKQVRSNSHIVVGRRVSRVRETGNSAAVHDEPGEFFLGHHDREICVKFTDDEPADSDETVAREQIDIDDVAVMVQVRRVGLLDAVNRIHLYVANVWEA